MRQATLDPIPTLNYFSRLAASNADAVSFLGAGLHAGFEHPLAMRCNVPVGALEPLRVHANAWLSRLLDMPAVTPLGGGTLDALSALVHQLASQPRTGAMRIAYSLAINPWLLRALRGRLARRSIEWIPADVNSDGATRFDVGPAADYLLLQQPNGFGVLEPPAHRAQPGPALIVIQDPLAAALTTPPGAMGAQFACGSLQPLALSHAAGGPHVGFIAGPDALAISAPAAEAPSLAAVLNNMAVIGASGIVDLAARAHANAQALHRALVALDGIHAAFEGDFFNEFTLRLELPVAEVLRLMAAHNLIAGVSLDGLVPRLENSLLVACDARCDAPAITGYADLLARILRHRASARCPVAPRM